MRKIYLLLLSLILLPYIAVAQTDDFNVTGGTSGTDYSYSEGVLTVNTGADITISMANGATEPTSDRIVVNGNAEITLNGVNITGSEYDDINVTNAQSAIDVSESATLILNLSESSQNTLTGGSGGNSVGAPGIHVPASSSLVIQGSGGLSVKGGNSTNTYGGNGIGGKSGSGQTGTACGTVVILATGTVTVNGGTGQTSSSGGADIGGGLGTTDGGNGQGIRPVSEQANTYTVWGDLTLPEGVTLPGNITLNIPSGTSLTLPEDMSLPEGIKLTGDGTISPDTAKPKPTITFAESVNLDKMYDGNVVSLDNSSYTYNGDGKVTIAWYEDNNNAKGEQLASAPVNAGTYWVGVSAEATNLYQAAEEVTKKFTITPATATSPQTPTLEAVTYGVKLSEITLPKGWTWEDGEIIPTVTNTGYTAYYTVTYYTNYDWSNVDGWDSEEHCVKRTLTLTVNKADPAYEEPTGLTAIYGETLKDVVLPKADNGTWSWQDVETTPVGDAGVQKFKVTFTPIDIDNYNVINDIEVTITVNQADISEQIKAESDTNISLDLETEAKAYPIMENGYGKVMMSPLQS